MQKEINELINKFSNKRRGLFFDSTMNDLRIYFLEWLRHQKLDFNGKGCLYVGSSECLQREVNDFEALLRLFLEDKINYEVTKNMLKSSTFDNFSILSNQIMNDVDIRSLLHDLGLIDSSWCTTPMYM